MSIAATQEWCFLCDEMHIASNPCNIERLKAKFSVPIESVRTCQKCKDAGMQECVGECKHKINIYSNIDNKPNLTKNEILSTGDWLEADYIGGMEGYFWKHKTILNDDYTFYMRRYKNDGFTTIKEEGKHDNKLFEGYIKTLDDLTSIINLCKLKEI